MKPSVSIIVPTYNRAKEIEKAVESLLRIDYPNKEIIIVDDGSTDNTLSILKKYKNKIKLIKRKFNGGPAAARNDGLKIAKGKYVAFTDSDCTVSKEWISKLVKFIENQPSNVAGVCGTIFPPRNSNFLMNCIYFMPQMDGNTGISLKAKKPIYVDNISCNNALWKKNIIKKFKFNETFFKEFKVVPEDAELCYRVKKRGYKFLMIPIAETYHHFRPTLWQFFKQSYNAGRGGGVVMMKHKDWFGNQTIIIYLFPLFLLFGIFFPIILFLPLLPCTSSAITASRRKNIFYFIPVMLLRFFKSYINLFGIWKGMVEFKTNSGLKGRFK